MTEPTIAHGGTRHGETIPITVLEMRHCDRLRDMEHRLIALITAVELTSFPDSLMTPGGDKVIPLAALKGAMAGAPC